MRILALGGPGAMGAVAARVVAGLPGVSEIVVADRRLDAAQAMAQRLSGAGISARVRALQVDVTDDVALRAALADVDVVVNTVGPYYRFGMAVLRAAIASGTHYFDICDDPEPTLQMLELDEAARAAGVCAVIGMGASPGVSNLLAARAVKRLDEVHDLYTAWPVDVSGKQDDAQLLGPDGRASAAAVHWMEQISGEITVVSNGELVHRRPLSPVTLALSPRHAGTAYVVGHPEPITLRRSFGLTGASACLMVITPGTLAYLDVLRRDLDAGRLDNEAAAAALAKPTLLRTLRAIPRAMRTKGPKSLPPFFAAATGTVRGQPVTVLARLAETVGASTMLDNMAEATGVPLGLGLGQLIDGTIDRPGVHPPETVIDAERFFRDLAHHLPTFGSEDAPDGVHVDLTPALPYAAVRR